MGGRVLWDGRVWTVVGIVGDVKHVGLDSEVEPTFYVPHSQTGYGEMTLVASCVGDPLGALPLLREAVWSVDPKIPLDRIETLQSQVDNHIGGFAVVANLMAVFALLSLFLGALGIYGVTAYAASRRTSEIGIRLALGAEPGDVVRMVVIQGGRRALLGLGLWTLGWGVEVTADRQLRRFLADPSNRGRVMDRGLWRYSRHPNYFGESLIWWGVFLVAAVTPGGWVTVFSPVLMTYFLVKVSGVRMLEEALAERRAGYREYMQRTSPFIPWPRRDPER